MSLLDQALQAAKTDRFDRATCRELLRLQGLAQGQEKARIGQLFESQLSLASLEESIWLASLQAGRGDSADPAPDAATEEESADDGSEIDWGNVAAETRIMLDLNRPAAAARKEEASMPQDGGLTI